MKKQLLFLLALSLCTIVNAQFKVLAESAVFKEPEDGLAKLMQLKNGNTVFMLIDDDKEIELHIYDAAHREKISTTLNPNIGKAKRARINNILEIKSDIVIFVMSTEDRAPTLYRVIIDGNTGALKEEKELFNIGKISLGNAYGMAWSKLEEPDFDVRKDPDHDLYSITVLNTIEQDRNKRIQIFMYGADHKEISRAYLRSPGNKYKYLTYGTVMMRNEKMFLLSRAYNTKASGDPEEKAILLATLGMGDTSVMLKELLFAKNTIIDRTMMQYNPATKNIMLLSVERENKSGYSAYLFFIDPETGKVNKSQPMFPQAVHTKTEELFGKKHAFSGMPVMFSVKDDGSFSVGYEEQTFITRTGSNYSSTSYDYGNLALSYFDKTGKETDSYLIPKDHYNNNYYGGSEGSATVLKAGNQFKEYMRITINGKEYILMNDLQENEENIQKGKLQRIIGVGECDAYFFELNGNNIIPQRQYLFGEPEKRVHNLALITETDYNKEKNILVTIRLQLGGKDKGMRIIWLEPK